MKKPLGILVLSLFLITPSLTDDISGIHLYQNIKEVIDSSKITKGIKLEYDSEVTAFYNDELNFEYNYKNEYRTTRHFDVKNPDYFFKLYEVWEKNDLIISVAAYSILANKVPQKDFLNHECSILRKQLIEEKIGMLDASTIDNVSQNFYREISDIEDEKIYFYDRIVYRVNESELEQEIEFTCQYKITYKEENYFITNYIIYAINEPGVITKNLQYWKAKKIEKFDGNYIKNFKIWGYFELADNITEDNKSYSLSEYRNQYFLKYKAEKENLEAQKKAEEEKKRIEQEKLEAEKEKLEAEKKAKEKIKKLNLEIDKIIEDYRKKIADISEPIKISKKKISILKNNLLNESNKIKVLETKYLKQNDDAKQYLTKDLELNCFIYVAHNFFLEKTVSVKVNLKYIKKKSSTSTLYSVNFEPFKKDSESFPEFYVYLDYLNSENIERCNVSDPRISILELLDLNEIKFRYFNNFNKGFTTASNRIRFMEDFRKNKKTKEKIKTLEQNLYQIKNVITAEEKSLTIEKKNYLKSEKELINKFSTKIFEIEKIILVIGKNLNIEQNRSSELDEISALIDVSKKNVEENDSQTDKVIQDQDKIDPTLTLSEQDALKAQILSCWVIPLGLPLGENTLVRIKLQLKPDGSVIKTEILDHARMNMPGQGFYKVLAESALRAIELCQPLRVPSTGYERWKDLQLNFDAREMLGG